MSGEPQEIFDNGNDDIAVLAHAINAGFAAIALRDREREHFMAIAAHELKTPVTSIQGYASLLADSPGNSPDVRRALEVIRRQSWRLSRLIETLFLAMRARSRTLRFDPKPLQLSRLVEHVLRELEVYFPKRAFSPKIEQNISILGDERLLEHALWALFTCAAALWRPDAAAPIVVSASDHAAIVTVGLEGAAGSANEIEQLFVPFQSIQYESSEGIRSAVGLFLCREIARVHSGRLYVRESSGSSEFVMELPR
jgi:signal transduction histidine kinase